MDNSIKMRCDNLSVGFLHEMADAEKTDWDKEILKKAAADGDKFHLSCDELKRVTSLSTTGNFDKWTTVAIYLKRRETNYRLGTKRLNKDLLSDQFCDALYTRLPAEKIPLQWKGLVHGALTCSFEEVCESNGCRPFALTNDRGEVEEKVGDLLADELINFKVLPPHFRINAIRLISQHATKQNVEKIAWVLSPIVEKQKEPDSLVRRHALWSLGEIASQIYHPEILEALLEGINPAKESDVEVRATAIAALSRVSLETLEQSLVPETLKNYLDPQKEKNPLIRREIVTALGRLALKKFAVSSFAYLSDSQDPSKEPDPYVREAVLIALWQIAGQPKNTIYQSWLEKSTDANWEPNVWVRRVAESAINNLKKNQKAPTELFEHLQHFSPYYELQEEKRMAALQKLVALPSKNALVTNAVISTFLRSLNKKWGGDPEIRAESITALGKMGEGAIEETVLAKLLELYRDENTTDAAVAAMTELGKVLIPKKEEEEFLKRKKEKMKNFEGEESRLESHEDGTLSEFAFSLGYLGARLSKDQRRKAGLRRALLKILESKIEPISFAREESLRALVKFEERDDPFFKALVKSLDPHREFSEETRILAAENLLSFAGPQNAVSLVQQLSRSLRTGYEPSSAVASAAMKTVSEIAKIEQLDDKAKKQLARMLAAVVEERQQVEATDRASAVNALAGLKGHIRNLPGLLLKWTQPEYEGDENVRLEAMNQLAPLASELNAKKVIPILLARLDEESEAMDENDEPLDEMPRAAMKVLEGMGKQAATEKKVIQKLETVARKENPFGLHPDDKGLKENHVRKKLAAWDALEVLNSYLPDPYPNVEPLDEEAVLQSEAFQKLEAGLALLMQYRGEGIAPPAGLTEEIRNLRDRNGSIGRALNESKQERFQKIRELYVLHVLDLPRFDKEKRRQGVEKNMYSGLKEDRSVWEKTRLFQK